MLPEAPEETRPSNLNFKLEGQNITYDIYSEYTPEKLEIIGGKLLEGERLLEMLIFNLGVKKVCEFIPTELLQEALAFKITVD